MPPVEEALLGKHEPVGRVGKLSLSKGGEPGNARSRFDLLLVFVDGLLVLRSADSRRDRNDPSEAHLGLRLEVDVHRAEDGAKNFFYRLAAEELKAFLGPGTIHGR